MASNPYGRIGGPYSYYTPYTNYGSGTWGPGEFSTTPVGQEYLNEEQDASFVRFLAENGWDDTSTRGQWAWSQLGRLATGYKAANADNPLLSWTEFLELEGPKLQQFYDSLSARQRGEDPARYGDRAIRQQFRR